MPVKACFPLLVPVRPLAMATLDRFIPSDKGAMHAIERIRDSLAEPDATGHGLRPGAAESCEISEDKRTQTFRPRDAKFSNGDPVMAAEAVNGKTVRITLKRPCTPVLLALLWPYLRSVGSEHFQHGKVCFSRDLTPHVNTVPGDPAVACAMVCPAWGLRDWRS